ncbi:MAG: response regulator transcription factor [Acidimicrobiales bacterium]
MAGETVLVVDDDPVIQKLLQVNFEMEGYVVLVASDGVEGLERARSHHPALVVLDVMMPRMNGLAVASALKDDPATAAIPVILLSAKAQEADLVAGRGTGAEHYVTKPFDPFELLDKVASLLSGPPGAGEAGSPGAGEGGSPGTGEGGSPAGREGPG